MAIERRFTEDSGFLTAGKTERLTSGQTIKSGSTSIPRQDHNGHDTVKPGIAIEVINDSTIKVLTEPPLTLTEDEINEHTYFSRYRFHKNFIFSDIIWTIKYKRNES